MSIARGFGQNGQALYNNIVKPVKIDLAFTVAPANANGLGVTSVKSNGVVHSVFMNTSQTPGLMNGSLNPNPAAGYCQIQFKNNFNKYLGFTYSVAAPNTGSGLTTVTAGLVYTIGTIGTTTLAQFQAKGLTKGLVPTVGQSFVATASGALGGTGTVFASGFSGINTIEAVGDPNQSISNSAILQNSGALLMLQFLAPTSASVTTQLATAPAVGSVISLSAWYDASSVTIDGL